MTLDPIALVRAQRQPTDLDEEMGGNGTAWEVKNLAMDPNSLARKTQPPEQWSTPDMLKTAEPIVAAMRGDPPTPTNIQAVSTATSKRVAIYVGRGHSFRVCVEALPDWDEVWGLTMSEVEATAVVVVCIALGVKLADKTGEFSNVTNQLGKDSQRPPTSLGPRRAGRPRKGAFGSEAGFEGGTPA